MFCNSFLDVPRRAHGYGMQNGVIRRAPMVQYSWVFAPGALCSTAADLVTWLQALHGGKVMSAASYTEMTTPARLADGTALGYGLGIKVAEDYRGVRSIGHGGSAPGFRADAAWYPEARMAVVVLMNTSPTNLSPAGVGGALAREVVPWPRPELTWYPGDPAELVGRYEYFAGGNFPGAVIEVSVEPTGLAFSVNGSPQQRLPWARGLTFYPQENVTLTFRRAGGETGPVTELRRDDPGNHMILRRVR
jgi:CubicO group peptidase (beta-lactamase class C family)